MLLFSYLVQYSYLLMVSSSGIWRSSYPPMTEHILMFYIYLDKSESVVSEQLFFSMTES